MANKKGNPNFKPKTPEQALKENVSEFRVRNATDLELKSLLAIGKVVRRRTIPDIIRQLITQFPDDQFTIREQKKRLDDLHRRLAAYQAREAGMKSLVEQFIKYTDQWNKVTLAKSRAILKKFTAPKRKGGGK